MLFCTAICRRVIDILLFRDRRVAGCWLLNDFPVSVDEVIEVCRAICQLLYAVKSHSVIEKRRYVKQRLALQSYPPFTSARKEN